MKRIIKEKQYSNIDGSYGLTQDMEYGQLKDKKIISITPVKFEQIHWIVVYEEEVK